MKNSTENGREIHFKGEELGDKIEVPGIGNLNDLFSKLLKCWDYDTVGKGYPYNRAESPSGGQCSITALLLNELIGAEIYEMAFENGGRHKYNIIDGQIIDLTSDQFTSRGIAIDYEAGKKKLERGDFSEEVLAREAILKQKVLK
jgi:hypothetical protein